jgi:hypothetical protein
MRHFRFEKKGRDRQGRKGRQARKERKGDRQGRTGRQARKERETGKREKGGMQGRKWRQAREGREAGFRRKVGKRCRSMECFVASSCLQMHHVIGEIVLLLDFTEPFVVTENRKTDRFIGKLSKCVGGWCLPGQMSRRHSMGNKRCVVEMTYPSIVTHMQWDIRKDRHLSWGIRKD